MKYAVTYSNRMQGYGDKRGGQTLERANALFRTLVVDEINALRWQPGLVQRARYFLDEKGPRYERRFAIYLHGKLATKVTLLKDR